MVAVDDVRLKHRQCSLNLARKGRFVALQVIFGKVAEAPAVIRHDIAHAHNRVGQILSAEVNESAPIGLDGVKLNGPVGLDAGHQKIAVSVQGGFP